MEYIFGTIQRRGQTVDILKTVGNEHTNLTDKHEIIRKYPDCTITDVFFVVEKYLTKTDDEGRCYDWYVLDKHFRYIDYFSPQKEKIDTDIAESQTAVCDLSEELDNAIADLENALCELTEQEE